MKIWSIKSMKISSSPSMAQTNWSWGLRRTIASTGQRLLSRFVLLASLANAQTAPTRFAGQACRLSVCSTDPAGAKKDNLLWSLKYNNIWCLIMKNECIYIWRTCLRQRSIKIWMYLIILPSAENYMNVIDFVESAFGR